MRFPSMAINMHSVDCQVAAPWRPLGLNPRFPEKAAMRQVDRPRGLGHTRARGQSGERGHSVAVKSLGPEATQSSGPGCRPCVHYPTVTSGQPVRFSKPRVQQFHRGEKKRPHVMDCDEENGTESAPRAWRRAWPTASCHCCRWHVIPSTRSASPGCPSPGSRNASKPSNHPNPPAAAGAALWLAEGVAAASAAHVRGGKCRPLGVRSSHWACTCTKAAGSPLLLGTGLCARPRGRRCGPQGTAPRTVPAPGWGRRC